MATESQAEVASRYRRLTGLLRLVTIFMPAAAIGVAFFFIFNFTIGDLVLFDIAYFFVLIALLFPLTFLLIPATEKGSRDKIPWYDLAASGLIFIISVFFFFHAVDILEFDWAITPPRHIYPISFLLLVLVVEGARRVGGPFLAGICLFFLFYPVFAGIMPGVLAGVSFSLPTTIIKHTLGSDGILGIPMRVVGTIIIGYLIFAAALQTAGGGRFFMNIAMGILGHVRGGPAKVAVLSSALFGSISGSVVANVVSTGSFTIPAMKKAGYPAYYAGALEASVSTGGVLMPPIMGATAFVMAEFLSIPYGYIVIAAFLPSILYYFAILIQVDARAAVMGLKGLPRETLPSARKTLKEGWFFLFALIVLVYMLLVRFETAKAPFYAIPLLLGLPMISRRTRLYPRDFIGFVERTGKLLAEIMPALLAIGLIINALVITGLAGALSSIILKLAGGNLYLLLLLGAITSFILGMGMSITACYVILALLLAPVLIRVGLDSLAVHLFVMYCGMISYITPPRGCGGFCRSTDSRGIAHENRLSGYAYRYSHIFSAFLLCPRTCSYPSRFPGGCFIYFFHLCPGHGRHRMGNGKAYPQTRQNEP